MKIFLNQVEEHSPASFVLTEEKRNMLTAVQSMGGVEGVEEFDSQWEAALEQVVAKAEALKGDKYEDMVRKELFKVWSRILDKYADPRATIPPLDVFYKEVYKTGVDASVEMLVKKIPFATDFLVRGQVERKITKGLKKIDFREVIQELEKAQRNPLLIPPLKERLLEKIYERD